MTSPEKLILQGYNVRKDHGRAFIINIEPIGEHDNSQLGWAKRPRPFVQDDTEELEKQLRACGYKVDVYPDKEHPTNTKANVEKCIESIKKLTLTDEYKEVDALLVFFSGYGDEGTIFCSGGNVEVNDLLMQTFKGDECQNLKQAPKVFILQTCNVQQYQFKGKEQADSPGGGEPQPDAAKVTYKIPAEANFAFIQCLIPGETPWRTKAEDKGSMFLSNFCKHIEKSPADGIDIHQIMTRTRTDIDTELMREDLARKAYEGTFKKLPLMSSTLIKKFRFKKM